MLKRNLIPSSRIMMAALVVPIALAGCNLDQRVSVDSKQGVPQVASSNSVSDSQTTSAVKSTSIEGETVHIGSIDWYVDYDTAMKVAKDLNKPIWLHFGENPG